MNLPATVGIVTEGNTVTTASVTWDTTTPASGSYNPDILTEQKVTLNGTVTCPDNVDASGVTLTTTITITISAAGIVGAPQANPTSGTYTSNQSVTLTSSTEGAEIYYTTDGTEPNSTGTRYTEAISVTGTEGESVETTIKAIAVKNGMQNSDVEAFTYTIKIPAQQNTGGGGGGFLPAVQKPTIEAGEGVKVTLSADGTVATITVDDGYELEDVVLNGTSKGKVTQVKGLRTGDKLVVTSSKKPAEPIEPTREEILALLAEQKLAARSKLVTMKNGKKAVRITWYNRNGEMMDFDGVEIFRSTKSNSGYGKKPIFTSATGKYYNTTVKKGTKYYYKVRGFVIIDGQKYYTDWSLKAIRTVK